MAFVKIMDCGLNRDMGIKMQIGLWHPVLEKDLNSAKGSHESIGVKRRRKVTLSTDTFKT